MIAQHPPRTSHIPLHMQQLHPCCCCCCSLQVQHDAAVGGGITQEIIVFVPHSGPQAGLSVVVKQVCYVGTVH